MDQYVMRNLQRWNELTSIHEQSEFYDLAGFRAGRSSLRVIERLELGDVAGQTVLHLQCHFGLDTMSLARLGAKATGVDFSDVAISRAQALSREMGIDARFVCADVYDLPNVLEERFDVVFTSYGVLSWLPDLGKWARVISHFLKPGGTFYVVEMHPFLDVFEDQEGDELRAVYPYFHAPEPMECEDVSTYADRSAQVGHTVSYQWTHSFGDILNSLIGAGLRIEFLHEFPFCIYAKFPGMTKGEDGWWRLRGGTEFFPLMFSLRATKTSAD